MREESSVNYFFKSRLITNMNQNLFAIYTSFFSNHRSIEPQLNGPKIIKHLFSNRSSLLTRIIRNMKNKCIINCISIYGVSMYIVCVRVIQATGRYDEKAVGFEESAQCSSSSSARRLHDHQGA